MSEVIHNIPLAEHFHSIQGEGAYTGTPMHFLRFPGCSVGKTAPKFQSQHQSAEGLPLLNPLLNPLHSNLHILNQIPLLPTGAEAKVCTTYDGREFWCDTDYGVKETVTLEELVEETWEKHVCFTGGEPLIHQGKQWFKDLVWTLQAAGKVVHLETSGTIISLVDFDWVTISPKKDFNTVAICQADQLKFLVDEMFDHVQAKAITYKAKKSCLIYISPIFDPNELVKGNVEKCFEVLRKYPNWRLGVQMHKFIGAR